MEQTSPGGGILIYLFLLLFLQSRAQGSLIGGNITVNTNLTLHGSPYVVSEDIVVAENVTLTIQPGVELHFDSGVGLHVKGSLQAKGNSQEKIVFKKVNGSVDPQNMNGTWINKYIIRLSDGNFKMGRLEIYLNGRWGTVCDDRWDMRDTQVACRQLGFLEAKRFYTHRGGTGPIWLDDLGCLGTEKSLLECRHRGIGSHNCGHRKDIGIECNVPAIKLLWSFAKTVYWKGVDYSSTTKPTSLQHVYISDAYVAITGRYFIPNLYHVTVKNSIYGVAAEEMKFPLSIRDSIIKDSLIEGIGVKGGLVMTTIENTMVYNTTYGDGLSYSGTFRDSFDFCSVDVNNITFPITFQALGKSSASIGCEKLIRTQPGRHLTVHYLSISGEMFDLEVHDGNTINATNLIIVNQGASVNQAVTPSVSSGHELYIRFQYKGRSGAAVKFLITDGRDFMSLVLSNCSFSDNNGRGVVLKDITGNITITSTSALRNEKEGISAESILGTVTTSDSIFVNNSAHGLHIVNSSLLSYDLHQLTINGNLLNGLYLKRVALQSNISDSAFHKNAYNGFALSNGAGNIEFRNITAVLNRKSGMKIYDGKASITFLSCNFFKNREDGCCISNQAGFQEFFNCTANSNSKHGISLFDVTRHFSSVSPRYQMKHFSLLDSSITDNLQYGVNLGPNCQYWSELEVNVTMAIVNNKIVRNNQAGVFLSPPSCQYWYQKPRKVSAIVRSNYFERNKGNAFYVYCTGHLGLDSAIESNKFINNTGKVLTLLHDNQCGARYEGNPCHLKIAGNVFKKNRVSENVLYIDFSFFPEIRSATVLNNTFNENALTTKDRFPKFYRRSTTRAVIVLKEGRFTVRENIITNPGFAFEVSTLRHNHRQGVDAKYNWWGTADECEIVDRIFDFRHRIQLSTVNVFPYKMSSTNSAADSSSISRQSCFLRNNSIGGPLDRLLVLSSAGSPYEVRDDISILPNGTLVIPKNVTLQFPPRSAMFVQGTLLVNGTENEKVNFITTSHGRNFRLDGGSGPWEGRVEFLVNGTWMPMCLPYYTSFSTEGAIICQQQNLNYKWYSRGYPSGIENGFVHNVACDGKVDVDIMNCSANKWRYGPTCQRYTVYVYCQPNSWVGLHLAMSNHQSSLRHLNIYDAGFPYRDDINIPGAAFKIDFNHHNISNIFVNRSEGIGVQVVYQSLLHKRSLMPTSTISNTKSHGIQSLSSLTATHVDMTINDGNGFRYSGSWRYSNSLGKINTFAADMASPEVNRIFYACSKNKTFLQANRVFHFTIEALNARLQLTCHHVMETEPGYKIVIQLLYYSHPGYYNYDHFMHVYDGLNMSIGSPWKIEYLSWEDRPVFNSTGSIIQIEFKKLASWNMDISFQLYTVKESDRVDYKGVQINIAGCKIVNNVQGGVLIDENVLKYLSIEDSEISNSQGFGIKVYGGRWRNHRSTTDFVLKNCLINGTRTQGVYVYSGKMKKIEIVNSSLTNCNKGIYWSMHGYFRNEFLFDNSKISDSLTMGVDIYSNHEDNVIRIENSSIIRSGDHGFEFSGLILSLLMRENTFAWNMHGAVRVRNYHYYYYYYNYQSTILFASNTFLHNKGPSVDIYLPTSTLKFVNNTFAWNMNGAVIVRPRYYYYYYYHQNTLIFASNTFLHNKGPTVDIYATKTTLKFVNNTFEENRGLSVIALKKWLNYYNYIPTVVVSSNRFSGNNCTEKAVIYIASDVTDAIINENDFLSNTGSCVLLESSAVHLPISITNNLFNQNDGGEKNLIEVQRVEENTKCVNNTFSQNKAGSVVLFQVVHKLDLSFQRTELIFNENNLFNNIGYNLSQPSAHGESCTVILSGILYYKKLDFRLNEFKNPDFLRDLCVRVPAISQRDFVNVTLNWWGTAIGSEVRDRISDFDDNYDFAVAKARPFLLSREDKTLVSPDEHDFKQRGHVLSGRLFESMTLNPSQSPYYVTSDFTVLENVTLTIEAGVMVKVNPGVSILVVGELKARGTISKPVVFTAKEPSRNDKALQVHVRLVGGDFPWEGRVDVFYNMSWKPISSDSNVTSNFYSAVCKQLGYSPLSSSSGISEKLYPDGNGSWLMDIRCIGEEVFLHECSMKQSLSNYSSSVVAVRCQAAAWGNMRFISSTDLNASREQSNLEHVEFSYCGNRHGMPVPAIETVTSVPALKFVTARNCIAGGVRTHFPQSDVKLNNNKFINTGKAGISFLQTRRNIIVENSESSKNERGISFEESSEQNVPRVRYGQVFLCDEDQVVSVKNQTLLYFDIPLVKTITTSGKCRKVLQAPKGQSFKMTILYFKGTQEVKVYDSIDRNNLIVDKSDNYMESLVHKELFIPRNTIVVEWIGLANSKVVFQVEVVTIIDAPCTFEVGFCGWNTISNMSINRVNATTTWRIGYNTRPLYMGEDYSYFSSSGKRLYVGNSDYYSWRPADGRAVIISPSITKFTQLCSLVFFYRLQQKGKAALSLYIQTGTSARVEQKLIWRARDIDVRSWKKVTISLPTGLDEYRLLLEGEYESSYYSRNYVAVDNLELRRCSFKAMHRISNSVFSGNNYQAIKYTSVADESDRRPSLTIERCKITDTHAFLSNVFQKKAISLEIQENSFMLSNNFIARNRLGAIQARMGRKEGTVVQKSFIYGNTFSSNANGTILVEQREGLENNHSFVDIAENILENNLGYNSTLRLFDIHGEIKNNIFYNNSGLHELEYNFSNGWFKGQKCEQNTFYLNRDLAQNYGVTVLSNGPMEYHKNNFKNPSNLYELSSTRQPVSDPVHAEMNWWGGGMESAVSSRIYDKNDDYRLARVEYKPFQKLPHKEVLSVGCPADWLTVGTTCMVFRGGGKTFKEAREYCQYYGGHVASMTTHWDVGFITKKQRKKRPDGKPPVPIWVTTEYNLLEGDSEEQKIQQCTVVTYNETQNVVPCNSLYPFICTRNAVIRCPNSCFHNGDCIGATCFCYPGWTALDCSQFDCKDVHNCSGNGQCVGPNVCKCKPGFMGRGCTYSYCTKFQRCSTCSQGAACGWCDSLQQCLPGTSTGPYSRRCPDWFYYTCYTVGNASHCSGKIQRVDCTNQQCNLAEETSNTETCQKCHDLEKCYQNVKEGNCKAWNDTRCPYGLVKVDYTDSNRMKNLLLRSNVKAIDPNTTKIFSCPLIIPDAEETTTLIIAPRSLDIKTGDVLSSPQAGGLMHKINETATAGPYIMMLGTSARIEEIIQYADFTQRVSPVQLVDESTVDEEPELDDLNGLIGENITLNNSNVHVLDSNISVFKCVGHIYRVQDEFVASQFLLINKEHAISVRPEDVIVSAQSHGFIEKVIAINHTSDVVFLETELERCTENSTWTHRIKRRQSGSSDNGVFCTGGDNNYGLIITELDGDNQNISLNDSIVGRGSNPIIAKVIDAQVNGDLLLIEVLPVQSIVNGTAVTAIRVDDLHKGRRRQRRGVDIKETVTFQKTYENEMKFTLFGVGYITAKQMFRVKQEFIISMGVFTKRDDNGNIVNVDAVFGLKIAGEVTFNVDVEIGIERSVPLFKRTFPIGKPVQIGSFCIPVYAFVCIPCGLFLEAELVAALNIKGKIFVPISFTSSAILEMGGSCSLSGGCQKEGPQVTVNRGLTNGPVTIEREFNGEIKLVPKLAFKLPVVPRWMRKMVILFRRKILRKVFKGLDHKERKTDSPILELSVEVPYALKAAYIICSNKCMKKDPQKPSEFKLSMGFSEIAGKMSVGLGEMKFEIVGLRYKLQPAGATQPSICFSVDDKNKDCGSQTTAPPTTGVTTAQSTTLAPTTQPLCECDNRQRGDIAYDGSCKCPPKCPKERKAIFVNKRYKCPEHPSCGEYPNCVVGRKGPGCSQADVPGCSSDCSGNGRAVALVDCGSRCACSARWTGACCERRRPWRNWGDPHLETLDGIDFDYFGIGEFWGCKSIFNDFGLQFRYFAYQRASLTGGVAIKTGQSILTIMTINTTNPRAFPKLRIDGALLNITAQFGQKMALGNGTVIMDIQKAFSNESEETGIMLLSLQFESGLTVTTDVRYSHVMVRQYLNVLFTPTVAFKGHTEGLCGVMDNDPSNDLRGPSGEKYNDPIQFADSWRITAVQSNSSFQGTWSWNSSNFHNDDVLDSSYIDPNFVPVYSLDGIDVVIVAKATAACSSLGLSKSMLHSCIYDVAVTNDTSLTAQETLQQDCPDQCSGKGRCFNSTCHCMIGWTGDSCQLGDCANCSAEHGTCVKGFCECEDGWEGATCEKKATCFNVNNCTSPSNGICRRSDQCRCHYGFTGIDCSIVPTCSNVSDCSGRGICIDYDVCKCQKEWTGKNCTKYSCASLDFCSGQGRCVAPYKCICNPGWTGDSCAAPDCAGANQCSGQGECVSSNTCQCYPGFQGANCSDVTDCSILGNCSGKGVCMQETPDANLTCRCFAGFSGTNCSIPSCLNVNNCSGHGLCTEADFCKCDLGYTGADCANASCEALNYCSGHGVCAGYDTCACDPLWHGAACSLANCSSLNDCSNKGDCILPNTCECYSGYDGVACNTTAKPNLHAPVFAISMYNLSLSENVPKRTKVLRVQASDADSGRNGQLFFSMDDGQDANSAFTIDSLSGDIFTLSAFDYESSSKKLHKLKIIASDNGIPPKSSFVFVYISIDDQNDYCPIFRSPQMKFWNISRNTPTGTLLTVIYADDKDSGLNGEVRYSLSNASNHGGAFKVDEQSGVVATAAVLKLMEYRLQVTARDLGVPSCTRQIELTVNTFADAEVTEGPSEVTTGVTTEEVTEAPSEVTPDITTEATRKSETTLLTKASTSQIPEFLPPSKSWYKEPSVIIGISSGGFLIFIVIPLVILCCWKWRCCKSSKPKDTGPSLGSHNEAMSESQITVHPMPCMYGDIQDRSSETYEMKNVSHVQ